MHDLLSVVASRAAWDSGVVRSVFFKEADIDKAPSISEIAERVINWIGERSLELDVRGVFSLSELCATLTELGESSDAVKSYIDSIRFKEEALRIDPVNGEAIEHSFDAVTRYLPDKDKIVSQALSRRRQINVLVALLKDGDWSQIVLHYRSNHWGFLAYDALGAFKSGKISMEQFSTLIFRWSLEKDFPEEAIEVIPLFNPDGSINLEARENIRQTLKKIEGVGSLLGFSVDVVSDEHLELFYKRMKRVPQSERYFFQFGTPPRSKFNAIEAKAQSQNQTRTITQEVTESAEFNVFNAFRRFDIEDENLAWRRMCASLSMMQQMLYAYKGDMAVKIVPVIGLSTVEDIVNNGLMGTREMAIPFPAVLIPKSADEVIAPTDFDFWNHDFYHAFVASHVPSDVRVGFINFAKMVKDFSGSIVDDPEFKMAFDVYFERIIDMEASLFRNSAIPKSEAFLRSITFSFMNVFPRLNPRLDKKLDDLDFLEEFQHRLHPLLKSLVAKINESGFSKFIGISATDLGGLERELATLMQNATLGLTHIDLIYPQVAAYVTKERLRRELEVGFQQLELLKEFLELTASPAFFSEESVHVGVHNITDSE